MCEIQTRITAPMRGDDDRADHAVGSRMPKQYPSADEPADQAEDEVADQSEACAADQLCQPAIQRLFRL